MNKPELLAPAGDLEKLKAAVRYGADAVYVGDTFFSLRAAAKNFNEEELKEGVRFAHENGVKVYLAANIFPHQADFCFLPDAVECWKNAGVDAVIISDLGLFSAARKLAPDLEIHVSTQANNVNAETVNVWHSLGAKRVVLARELSFEEICDIRRNVSVDCELEMFIHGAMCISYSGRCLLSNYMADRDSNKGACAQPCRWNYSLVEEKRPNEFFPVYEDERGTYIFNSRDLNLLPFLPQIIQSGVSSLKIEGRVKSEYYVASVVKVYREAIDAYFEHPDSFTIKSEWLDELKTVSHRAYGSGFFEKKPDSNGQIYGTSSYIRDYEVVGVVVDYHDGVATIEQRNRFFKGDEIEFLPFKGPAFAQKVEWLKDDDGIEIDSVPHPQMRFSMPCRQPVEANTFVRKKK